MVKKIYLIAISMMVLIQSVFSAEEGSLLSDGFKEIIDKEISFQWKVEGEDLLIRLSAPTEGWVAVAEDPFAKDPEIYDVPVADIDPEFE